MKFETIGDRNMQKIRTFLKNNKGATAIEYGLIAALIAVAAIAAMQGLGNQLKTTFQNVSTNMKAG
jgi:pilus assembly protein Flp/PilA